MLLKGMGDIQISSYLYLFIYKNFLFLKCNFRFITKLGRTEISPILPVPKQA